jgi:hypothetical protein
VSNTGSQILFGGRASENEQPVSASLEPTVIVTGMNNKHLFVNNLLSCIWKGKFVLF